MKRFIALLGALILGLSVVVPGAFAAEPLAHTGRVLVSTEGDVTIPRGDHADVVVVVEGNADIQGVVNTLVVVEGTATLTGASVETVVAVRSRIEVGAGTVISGEVQRLESTIHQSGNAEIRGGTVELSERWIQAGAILAPALAILWLGFGLSTLVAGLLLAGLAARQVRAAGTLISQEPALTLVAGILGVIVIPVGAILLVPTLIGAPLGIAVLVVALPLIAFGGYLVAATWIGEWLLRRTSTADRDRPYLAVVLGVVALGAVGLVPVVSLVVAIASLLGFGAILVLGLRTLIGSTSARASTPQAMPLGTPA
jgi:hypothetical protein